jgi:phosphatidylinositol N-acetylglucosaminyltransferase subunit P
MERTAHEESGTTAEPDPSACGSAGGAPSTPAAIAPPGPTQVAVYGFVAWALSAISWVLYVLWAFLPGDMLRDLGVEYFPSKYWASALPAHFCVSLFFTGMAYVGLNLMRTAPLDSLDTIHDNRSRALPPQGNWSMQQDGRCAPELADLPIKVVNRMLYQSPVPSKNMASAAAHAAD